MTHPAAFTRPILQRMATMVGHGWRVLDPFAGVGRIHDLPQLVDPLDIEIPVETVGVELEPDWAAAHERTIVGDARHLPFPAASFDAVVTSPTFGNRMADKHNAQEKCSKCDGAGEVPVPFMFGPTAEDPDPDKAWHILCGGQMVGRQCEKCGADPRCTACKGEGKRAYKRMTYRHSLGHDLSEGNTGGMAWGPRYREVHVTCLAEMARVVKPGGRLIFEMSDHIRAGRIQHVTDWWVTEAMRHGWWTMITHDHVETPRMRQGANYKARVEFSSVVCCQRTERPAGAGLGSLFA